MISSDLVKKIRKLRPADHEIGGRILDGKITELIKGDSAHVQGLPFFVERYMAQLGYVSFHTHPDDGFSQPSGMDYLAVYIRGYELIFCKDCWLEVIPKKDLTISEIVSREKKLWVEAQAEEEVSGNPAYWIWKGLLREEFPIEVIKHEYD